MEAGDSERGALVGVRQAAAMAGVSDDTIRRRLRMAAIPGAVLSDDGSWKIPVTGLVAAGFSVSMRTDVEPAAESSPEVWHAVADARAVHIEDLRLELARLHRVIEQMDGRRRVT